MRTLKGRPRSSASVRRDAVEDAEGMVGDEHDGGMALHVGRPLAGDDLEPDPDQPQHGPDDALALRHRFAAPLLVEGREVVAPGEPLQEPDDPAPHR